VRSVTSASTRDPFFFWPAARPPVASRARAALRRRARRLSRPPHPSRVCSGRRRPPVRFVCPPPVAALPSAAVAAPSPSPVVKPAACCSRSSPLWLSACSPRTPVAVPICRRLLRPSAGCYGPFPLLGAPSVCCGRGVCGCSVLVAVHLGRPDCCFCWLERLRLPAGDISALISCNLHHGSDQSHCY
jgi:hypothetical protein